METVVIDEIHYHTHDNGKHLFPCLRKEADCHGNCLNTNNGGSGSGSGSGSAGRAGSAAGRIRPPTRDSICTVVKTAKHQVQHLHDPLAKQSRTIMKVKANAKTRGKGKGRARFKQQQQGNNNLHKDVLGRSDTFDSSDSGDSNDNDNVDVHGAGNGDSDGDGDVWVEVLCKHIKTGQIRSYFKSTKDPHRRVADEPPTGASHVIYLKSSYIEKHTK